MRKPFLQLLLFSKQKSFLNKKSEQIILFLQNYSLEWKRQELNIKIGQYYFDEFQ